MTRTTSNGTLNVDIIDNIPFSLECSQSGEYVKHCLEPKTNVEYSYSQRLK